MGRSIVSVVAGFLSWWLIGTAGFLCLRALWPAYASAESSMAFSTGMQLARLATGLLCSLGAGAIVSLILRRRSLAPWILGAILTAQFLPIHYHLWTKYPLWYHAFFFLTLAPAIALGARCGLRRVASSTPGNSSGCANPTR